MHEYMTTVADGDEAGRRGARPRDGASAGDGGMTLIVCLAQDGIDDERLERLTDGLRRELLDLGVERASLGRSGQAPVGTKAGETMTTVGVLVALLGSPLLAE